jgi:single-strand DNA-binding protein
MLNKVELIGRVGGDIELKTTQSGKTYSTFTLATNKSYNDKNTGNKVETTAWHRIKVWGKLAEIVSQYSGKGRLLFIEGELEYSDSTDASGVKTYYTAIRGSNVTFLDKNNNDSSVQPANVNQAQNQSGHVIDQTTSEPQVNTDFTADDIPF